MAVVEDCPVAEHFVSAEQVVEVIVVVKVPSTFMVENTVQADAVAAWQDEVELDAEVDEVSSFRSFSLFGSS